MIYITHDYRARANNIQRITEDLSYAVRLISSLNFDNFLYVAGDDADADKPSDEKLIAFLTQVANIFTLYTNDTCACCIKLFDIASSNTGPNVHTHQRDAISKPKREHIDEDVPNYEAFDNTAFRSIINNGEDRQAFFLENNLKKKSKEGEYENKNRHWRDYYNAALVVPISRADNPRLGEDFYGFLCIDNKRGGFDKQFCLPLAFLIEKLIYEFLKIFNIVVEEADERG